MKKVITNYTFDASAQTIALDDYTSIDLERVLLITNITDGIVIYAFNDPAIGGSVATNVLTLAYDTTGMADADKLQIFYEEEDVVEVPATLPKAGSIYSNVLGDFTAVANSGAKTITLSAYANTVLSSVIGINNLLNGLVIRRSSAGAVDVLPLNNATYAANVYTLADMEANFAAGDTVVVYLVGPDKALDKTADAVKTTDASANESTIDTVTAKIATDALMNDTSELVPKFACVSAAASGNNTIIAAVTSKKIRVISLAMSWIGTVNGKFQSGAGGTDISKLFYGVANTQVVLPFNPLGWFETASGSLLNLNLSTNVAIDVTLQYVEV